MEFNHFFFCLVTVACYWVTHNCLTLFVRNYLLALTDISNGILDPELELNSNKKPQIVRHQNPIHTEMKLKVVFKHTAIKCAWGGNRSHHSSAVVRPIFRSGSPQCRPHTHVLGACSSWRWGRSRSICSSVSWERDTADVEMHTRLNFVYYQQRQIHKHAHAPIWCSVSCQCYVTYFLRNIWYLQSRLFSRQHYFFLRLVTTPLNSVHTKHIEILKSFSAWLQAQGDIIWSVAVWFSPSFDMSPTRQNTDSQQRVNKDMCDRCEPIPAILIKCYLKARVFAVWEAGDGYA